MMGLSLVKLDDKNTAISVFTLLFIVSTGCIIITPSHIENRATTYTEAIIRGFFLTVRD